MVSIDFVSDSQQMKLYDYVEKVYGSLGMKIYKISWDTWPRWPPCPCMVKTFKNLLLQQQLTDGLVTWFVALGTRVQPRLLNDDFGLTLTFLQQVQLWRRASCNQISYRVSFNANMFIPFWSYDQHDRHVCIWDDRGQV